MADSPTTFSLIVNFYGFYLPFILFAIWGPLALIDMAQRDDISPKSGITWVVAIFTLPLVGAALYHLVGGSRLPNGLSKLIVGIGVLLLGVVFILSNNATYY